MKSQMKPQKGGEMTNIGHGGKEIVERITTDKKAVLEKIQGLTRVPVRRQIATEAISIAYGFFSPLEGFMTKANVESTIKNMALADGTLWSIPIVYDMTDKEISDYDIKAGGTILLTYEGNPLATFDVEDIFTYDKQEWCQSIYGTTDAKHPGVKRTNDYADKFLGGKITLVNPPKMNPPFDAYWRTPLQHRDEFRRKGWARIVNHQTRNVPHTGHEWLMKHAWMATHAELSMEETEEGKAITGVLVNCIIGEKRTGDYIDQAILLTQDALKTHGYFRSDIHMTTFTLWDMRYAGPKEAIHHAIIRTNLGLTHHMFGRDHAGVGTYYHPYEAHRIFKKIPEGRLGITPIFVLEWLFCPHCGEVTCTALCGHEKEQQKFSGTVIRSILMDGVKPTRFVFRPEIFDIVMECAEKYGFGSPFVTPDYLERGTRAFRIDPL